MKKLSIITTTFISLVAMLSVSFTADASMYSRRQAKATIEQTSYVINEAYEIARYYSFWQTNNVSRAMYYNNYAQDLYFYHFYKTAIRYSLLARQYALEVIDDCDDYWEYFYYTYYGWSFRYGYNYNFGYRNGYRDGYYDGYYARYCSRYRHDYRKDPYHNMHNDWYTDQRYNDVASGKYFNQNNGSVAIGRGDTGRTGNTSSNGSSSSTLSRPGYTGEPSSNNNSNAGFKNVVTNNYFSQNEIAMMKDLPSETATMEKDFLKKNPEVSFSDENLSTKSDVIKRNTTNSSNYISQKSNKTTASQMELQRPSAITLQDGQTISGKSSDLSDQARQTIQKRAAENNVPSTLNDRKSSTSSTIINSNWDGNTSNSSSSSALKSNNNTIQRSNTSTTNSNNSVQRNNTSNNNNNSEVKSTRITSNSNSSSNNNNTIQRSSNSTSSKTTTPTRSTRTTRTNTSQSNKSTNSTLRSTSSSTRSSSTKQVERNTSSSSSSLKRVSR